MKRVIRFFYYLFQLERLPSRDAVISGAKQWLIGLGFCAVAFAGLALGVLAIFAVGCWMLGSWLVHDSKRAALEQLQRLRNAFKQAWSRACGTTT